MTTLEALRCVQVFALIKERDALKRAAAAAASSSTDNSGDVKRLEAELQKKEELVAQVRHLSLPVHVHLEIPCF